MKCPRLLCVDDDPGMRAFYAALLSSHGYEVVLADSGGQALAIVRSEHSKIDAVITDYDMPQMDGPALAAALKRLRPRLPIVMVSGSQPTLEDAPHFVDAALDKSAPIHVILGEIERLLASYTAFRGALLGSMPSTVPLLAFADNSEN